MKASKDPSSVFLKGGEWLNSISKGLFEVDKEFTFAKSLPYDFSLPSRKEVSSLLDILKPILLPFGKNLGTSEAEKILQANSLIEKFSFQFRKLAHRTFLFDAFEKDLKFTSEEIDDFVTEKLSRLLEKLADIKMLIYSDVKKAFDSDPAVYNYSEIVSSYPSILAMFHHRVSHELYKSKTPLLPRLISEAAHSLTGIDIHPGATIGKSFFIDHGTGVVIGETSEIGDNVTIYQGVTLGVKNFPTDENNQIIKGLKRHPVLQDNVTIYSGSSILGRVTIGKGSIIGGNIWLTDSVPENSRVIQMRPKSSAFEFGAGI